MNSEFPVSDQRISDSAVSVLDQLALPTLLLTHVFSTYSFVSAAGAPQLPGRVGTAPGVLPRLWQSGAPVLSDITHAHPGHNTRQIYSPSKPTAQLSAFPTDNLYSAAPAPPAPPRPRPAPAPAPAPAPVLLLPVGLRDLLTCYEGKQWDLPVRSISGSTLPGSRLALTRNSI